MGNFTCFKVNNIIACNFPCFAANESRADKLPLEMELVAWHDNNTSYMSWLPNFHHALLN